MTKQIPACLAIGGFDPSGGAGLLADAEAISAAGARPLAAVTTVTAQNHLLFHSAWPVPVGALEAQLEALLCAFPIRAVKTGAFPTADHVRLVAAVLRGIDVPLVVDPVLGASRGRGLVGRSVRRAIVEHLLPMAALVTPNAAEAGALARVRVADEAGARDAARTLVRLGARAVLVKGGHIDSRGDLLAAGARLAWLPTRRVHGVATHGTGCALASAIAGRLALGRPLPEAVAAGRALVARGLRSAALRREEWGPDLIGARIGRS